jgi:hypothetical protein
VLTKTYARMINHCDFVAYLSSSLYSLSNELASKLDTCTFLQLKIVFRPDVELQAAIKALSYRAIVYSLKQGTYKALSL